MLHILMSSPFKCDFDAFLRFLRDGDDVILIQDGVLAAQAGNIMLESLLNAPISLFVLEDDLLARGLVVQNSTRLSTVSYTDFVTLTVKNPQQITW